MATPAHPDIRAEWDFARVCPGAPRDLRRAAIHAASGAVQSHLGNSKLPLCWPVDGRCGCGRGHQGRDIGKAPLAGRDYQHLRADERQAREWWRRWPQANIGLLLEPAGLLVLDLHGPAAVAEADARGCAETRTIRRGDRLHLYFSRPAGVEPGRRTRKVLVRRN